MPPIALKPFAFTFQYDGETYYFETFKIFKNGKYICHCDLTATKYYGDELVTLICCKIALKAYYYGVLNGKHQHMQEVSETFKNLLGL